MKIMMKKKEKSVMWNDNDQEDRQVRYPMERGITFQEKESLFSRIILFRALPILMAVLSMSCLFFGWIRIPDDLTSDLNTIEKYVSKGNSLLEKYLGTSEIAGIDTAAKPWQAIRARRSVFCPTEN